MEADRFRAGQVVDGRVICGAKAKHGGPCRKPPVNGRARCRLHGGATPRGMAHPNIKHGRFSKDLPTRMAATYHEALADPDLIAVRDEIALLTAREGDLVRRVDTGESGGLWRDLRGAWAHVEAAGENEQARDEALAVVGELIERANDDHRAWRELMATIEVRRKLVETERRRLVDGQTMISGERAIVFAMALLDAVKRNVEDRGTLARIGAEFSRLMNRGDGSPRGENERNGHE